MSEIAERARVALFLSDYAGNDAAGKVNALGAGWALTGVDPATGLTAAWSVVAMVDVPPQFYNDDFALALTLRDAADRPVSVPGPAGAGQTIQMAQNVHVDEPAFPPGANVPRHRAWAHVQVIVNFGNGLPLSPGQFYTWTLEIDGVRKEHRFIRADRFSSLDETAEFALVKGRQIIDEQGDRLFK